MSDTRNGVRCAAVLLLTAAACFTLPVQALEQPSNTGVPWEQLLVTPPGSRVKIRLRNGEEGTGTLVSVGPESVVLKDVDVGARLTLTRGGSLRDGATFDRAEIASIEVRALARSRPATASSFEQLKVAVAPGSKVNVTDATGASVSGTIVGLSSSTLTLKVGGALRELTESDVVAIRQRGDSLANGTLIGFGSGFGAGLIACGGCHIGPGLGAGAVAGGMGAAIGAGVDALIRRSRVVYERGGVGPRVSIASQLAPSHKAVTVSISF